MDYKSIIESKYNRQNWQLLLHDIFGKRANLQQQPFRVETSSSLAKSALCLGKITLSDEQTIAVYEVELSDSVDMERNRRGIRDMLASAWRGIYAGAFMLCYRNNESVLRFSYVSESWMFAEDGTYQKESTDTKRFTYLLGEGHRSRTAIQQFETLRDSALSLKDITKAFSVEAVGDMFFKEYKKNYEDIIYYVTGKRMVKVANKWEEKQVGEPCDEIMSEFSHFANPEKAVRDYVKKLMGRLVFLQFLQKKGWLGVRAGEPWGTGDSEFIQKLFTQTADKDHFVDNVLESLFNDIDSEDEKKLPQYRTPYLNGGLFERDASDEANFPLPAKYMKHMLDFFSSYNFTIDENDPDDAEVGVDPEMLGRIFENLLEDNKDKGTFYTPKEIVTYMCRESLIAYLQTDVDDEATKEAIRKFVTNHDSTLLGDIANDIDQRLKDVKICDPAIGSGAFPMGLLKELFLCRSAIEGFDQSTAAEIKKHIIQNNIYGVDIEKGAVDIARLRFWLSLIVDEETPQALPNLDFKIMRGNSLLEQYKGFDLSTIMHSKKKVEGPVQMTFFEDDVDVLRRQVIGLRREYFRETNKKKKKELRQRMREIVQQQINALSYNINLSGIDIADNSEFFLWHTWFSDVFEDGGFDIVIGNPPYVDSETMVATIPELRNEYSTLFDCARGNWDMFVVFIQRGLNLCKNRGVYSFIIPNKLVAAKYADKIRDRISKYEIREIRDYSRVDVFSEASVYPCTIIGRVTDFDENKEIAFTTMKDKSNAVSLNVVIGKTFDSCPYWDVFFRDAAVFSIIQHYLSNSTLANNSDLTILGAATVGEAYAVKDVIMDSYEHEDSFKIINTGTIDKYISLWGISPMQYIKGKYLFPRISYTDLMHINKTRLIQAKSNKIVVAGMSKEIEATYDKGEILAGKSTSIILSSDENLLKYVLGIINSKLVSFSMGIIFNSLKMSGGFLNIGTRELLSIPLPEASDDKKNEIVNYVNRVLQMKAVNTIVDTKTIESKIDAIVYQLYGLTEEEIKIVEQA